MPDRLPSLILLAGFWIPPAVAGWIAAGSAGARPSRRTLRATQATLATCVVAWSALWFAFQLDRMPPYIPGATSDPTFAPPEAVRGLLLVAVGLVLPGSVVACVVSFRRRIRRLRRGGGTIT